MDERRKELLQKWANEYGMSVDELVLKLDRMEAKGELGFGLLKKLMGSELEKQEDTRALFSMAAQEGEFSSTDEYLEVFPNLSRDDDDTLRKKFSKYKIKNDRLQQKNIMITPEMWHTLVENSKVVICDNTFKSTASLSKGQVVFSELLKLNNLEEVDSTISHRKDCDALILRTVQFDFLNLPENYESGKIRRFTKKDLQKSSRVFENFLNSVCKENFDEIYSLSENCLNFSIHEYYLPYGLSKSGMERAVLLLRYDHCYEKHKNSSLPKYYNEFFAPSVIEPHFHFNEGFGQIYKLMTTSGQANFGSGYAIGLSSLYSYLDLLNNLNSLPKDKKNLLENNDFGMPFLNILTGENRSTVKEQTMVKEKLVCDDVEKAQEITIKGTDKREAKEMIGRPNDTDTTDENRSLIDMQDCLLNLYIANAVNSQYLEFATAYKFFDMIGGNKPRNMEDFKTVKSKELSYEEIMQKKFNPNDRDNCKK